MTLLGPGARPGPRARDEELLRQTGMLAHDLREPLRKILFYGARLGRASGVALDAEAGHLLTHMLDAARRMHGLVADLLGYVAVGAETVAFARVALDDVVAAALDDLSLTIEETGGAIAVAALPVVDGNPEQLRQVACNLIGNALKFARPGIAPVVRIVPLSEDGEAGFAIEDDGIGFAREDAMRLFGVFERLNARADYPGNGIGLAICRRIVDAHDGRLVASAMPGRGARFEVWLPTDDPASDA